MLSVSGDAYSGEVETELQKVAIKGSVIGFGRKKEKKPIFFSFFFRSVFNLTEDVSFIE